MNAVEIEEAVSEIAAAPFDADEFSCAFLGATIFRHAGVDPRPTTVLLVDRR